MKNLRSYVFGLAVSAAAVVAYMPQPAQAQTGTQSGYWNFGTHGVVGHGHYIHARRAHNYFPKSGPYGYGNYGVADRWRDTPHWHYYPSGVYRQGNRYQYIEGHYEWHQGNSPTHHH